MQANMTPAAQPAQALPDGTTILQVLPALGHGGVERGTLEVAGAILAAGGRALVACERGANVEKLERMGGEFIDMNLASKNPLTIRANGNKLADLIKAEGVSIVHARSRAPAWAAKRAVDKTGTPFVTTFHAAYGEGGPLKRQYNSVMAAGDRVIAISHFIAKVIRDRYQTPLNRMRIIHRGVDLDTFRPEAVGAGRIAKVIREWGVAEDARIVMMPARLTRLKGHMVLIDAIALLLKARHIPELVCVLVGDDEGRSAYRDELVERVETVGLDPHRVVIAPHCEDMAAAMMASEVIVSASTEPEGFGRTMAEAAAMGKPVVASSHGAAGEIVVNGETGWLVAPGKAVPLARALETVFTQSPKEREVLATKATYRANRLFSRETMCRSTLDVYRELLKTGAKR